MPQVPFLIDLMDQTERVLIRLQIARKNNHFDFDSEAINWSDLHCHSAELAIDYNGNIIYRVYIEEASPSCFNFQAWVVNQLKPLQIEVVTEW